MKSPTVVLSLAALIALTPTLARPETLTGKVVAVADGDTVTVLDETNEPHKIRLAGIDSPEKKQAFGNRAKQNMAAMVFGKPVQVEWNKRDKYGRIVGKILVAPDDCIGELCRNSVDVGLSQISVGLAWHYKQYEKEQNLNDRKNYAQAELHAKYARTGLWSDNNPIEPWAFRRITKTNHN